MSIPAAIRLFVRERATFRCEYCGVSETDAGGEPTFPAGGELKEPRGRDRFPPDALFGYSGG